MIADYASTKRIFDVALALATLILLSPVLIAIAIAVAIDSPGPVLYIHERIGQFGRPFPFFKFRTMVVGADRMGRGYEVSAQDARITRLGGFLRRWHLDEVPQLLNVLRGDMSLVGPRPTLAYQVEQYTPQQRKRLLAPQGLTGVAQIKGLNALTWPQRIEWDVWYVEHATFWLDIQVMMRTFGVLAAGENVYGHGWEDKPEGGAEAP